MPFKYRAEARELADKVEDLMQRVTDKFHERAGYSKETWLATFASRVSKSNPSSSCAKEYYWLLILKEGTCADDISVPCTYREQEDMIHLINASVALKAL